MTDQFAATRTREFKIRYGLTASPEVAAFGELKYTGILKISPDGIGIYRTGEAWLGTLLTLAMSLDWWGRRARPEISTSAGTDGTPEHIIDPEVTTAFYDRSRNAVILDVPGATAFVLKVKGGVFGTETQDLLDCLKQRLGRDVPAFESKTDYLSLWPVVLTLALIIVLILVFLFL